MEHSPIPPETCASCGVAYYEGCPRTHHHSAWFDCYDFSDIRSLWCGCTAHKGCQKSGNVCREHGPPPA
jgi:hypothetical protein